jgi:aminoglycoside phosphotransferase (APT) family kinase protein
MGEWLWRDRTPQPHRLNPGFPGGDALIERYAATSGRDVDEIDVYCVLAVVKIAIIAAGSLARMGTVDPERVVRLQPTIERLAQLALDRASASAVPALRG